MGKIEINVTYKNRYQEIKAKTPYDFRYNKKNDKYFFEVAKLYYFFVCPKNYYYGQNYDILLLYYLGQ